MNKATKGAIAAGAAGILLAGGAGTFALWSETTPINAGTVTTGALDLTLGTGSWSEDLSTIVPGDSITYTTPVTISATGDNLTGKLVIDEDTFNTAFAAVGTENVTASVDNDALTGGGLIVDPDDENLMTFVEAGNDYTFNVTITVLFSDATTLQEDQNLQVVLPDLSLKLEQTPAA